MHEKSDLERALYMSNALSSVATIRNTFLSYTFLSRKSIRILNTDPKTVIEIVISRLPCRRIKLDSLYPNATNLLFEY